MSFVLPLPAARRHEERRQPQHPSYHVATARSVAWRRGFHRLRTNDRAPVGARDRREDAPRQRHELPWARHVGDGSQPWRSRSSSTAGGTAMSVEQNKTLVRRLMEEDMSRGDEAVADAIIHPAFVEHTDPPGMQHGPDGHK